MNLIEQLGGYEKAKKWLDENSADIEWRHLGDYRRELLEYRRQHNIFEVGDWIVVDSYKPEYWFYQINKDDVDSHWINLVKFRHATDEEIKVGKRL